MIFPADDATCRRALLVGNLHPAVNTDQVRRSGLCEGIVSEMTA